MLVGYETGYSHITISYPTSAHEIIVKYHDLSVSRRSIICLSLLLRQLIDMLATDKSRYFAQPRSIIVKYVLVVRVLVIYLLDSTIHLINHYPLDNLIASGSTYRGDCDLSAFCLAKASVLKKQYSWQIPCM